MPLFTATPASALQARKFSSVGVSARLEGALPAARHTLASTLSANGRPFAPLLVAGSRPARAWEEAGARQGVRPI